MNVAVGLMLIEGIGQALEPDTDLLRASVPFLQEAMRRRMQGDISPNETRLKGVVKTWWQRKLKGVPVLGSWVGEE